MELSLKKVPRADLVQPQPHRQPRRDRRVVIPLQRPPVPEEVDGEEAARLEDVHDAVRVLEGVGDAAEGAPEEVRLERGVGGRAGEVAGEEVDGVDERGVRFWLVGVRSGEEEEGGFEAADVHVEAALVAVGEEDIEAVENRNTLQGG